MCRSLLHLFPQDGQRIDKLQYSDARRSCDAIVHALKLVEDNIGTMFSDINALKEGQYHQAEQMQRRSAIPGNYCSSGVIHKCSPIIVLIILK